MLRKNQELISLKEAAKISGYSADYVGQLIRSGKLPGKQVFSHVAWMTTEAELREYMALRGVAKPEASLRYRLRDYVATAGVLIRKEFSMPRILTNLLYLSVFLLASFLVLLFFVFSTSVEHKLDKRALDAVEMRNTP